MGEAFIFGNGGGSGGLDNAYAIISVEYPAGSTLTCTNAATGKTYRAGNTYGAWAFGVNSNGTWRVTASNSTGESTFHDVAITAEHEAMHIELSYKTFLYNSGDLCRYDWKICRHGNSYVTPGGDEMYYSSSSPNARVANGFFVNQKIDLTDYSTLSAHILEVEPITDAWLFVTDAVQTSNQIYYYITSNVSKIIAKKQFDNPLADDDTVTLDVSNLNGEYYINIGSRALAANSKSTLKVDQVWLAK